MSNGDFCFVEIHKDLIPSQEDLPGDLRDVAEIVGVPLTLKLAQRFRGVNIYFRNIDVILRKQRNIEIRKAYDGGTSVQRLSLKHHISVRQVWNIIGSMD